MAIFHSDSEKGGVAERTTHHTTDVDVNFDSDANSSFQEGVERARAITAVWSKWTLISMFSL